MSAVNDDNVGAVVAFVSGALIGVAATLLFVRMQENKRMVGSRANDEDYYYDGGDIFI